MYRHLKKRRRHLQERKDDCCESAPAEKLGAVLERCCASLNAATRRSRAVNRAVHGDPRPRRARIPETQRLMQIPGGDRPVTRLTYRPHHRGSESFRKQSRVGSYLGLPTQRQRDVRRRKTVKSASRRPGNGFAPVFGRTAPQYILGAVRSDCGSPAWGGAIAAEVVDGTPRRSAR